MGKKDLNPADVYRKQQRKKELKKCKENRNVVRSVQELLSDPNKIEEEIQKAQKASDASALDKGLKDRIKELKMMKGVALTKQKIDIASGKADRDAAAEQKATELLQRDRRKGLIPGDHYTSGQKGDIDPLIESHQKKQQDSSSSSREILNEKVNSQVPIQNQLVPPAVSMPVFNKIPVQQHAAPIPIDVALNQRISGYMPIPQQSIPVPIGIAPMLDFASNLSVPPPPFFRPPPPVLAPGMFGMNVPPPLFQPPPLFPIAVAGNVEGIQCAPSIAMPLPPAPPPRPIFMESNRVENVTAISDTPDLDELQEESGPRNFDSSEGPKNFDSKSEAEIDQIQIPSAFPFSFSLSDFKLPSAAELMKRRHAVAEDTEAATVDYDHEEDCGPSYPQREPLAVQEPSNDVSADVVVEEDIESEEIVEVRNSYFARNRNIYIPPTAPVVPTGLAGGLGGLADYGSDSDEDDDARPSQSAPSSSSSSGSSTAAVSAVPRFVPLALPAVFTSYEPAPSAAAVQSTAPPYRAPKQSQPVYQAPVSAGVEDDVTAFLNSIDNEDLNTKQDRVRMTENRAQNRPVSSVPLSQPAPVVKPVLKSIRPDSALTAFLPSALRVKRPAVQAGRISKVQRVVAEEAGSVSGSVGGTKAPQGSIGKIVGGVEDAYLNFLDEIGELTG